MKYVSKQYTVTPGAPWAPYEIPFVAKPEMESQMINGYML